MSRSSDRYARDRAETNPLFGDAKFKLGTFCTNLSGGCTISSAEGMLEADWASTTELARRADEMKFEALVPVGRWKGFGGDTNFNGEGFECYTWAAGIAALTKYSAVFSTSHVPTVHPCMAAKQGMTIDHISGGRFVLNVVNGWYQPEIEMFGAPLLEHDKRYDMAAEWIEIVRKLWVAEEEFSYDGKYYTVTNAICGPRPVQRPHPVIMCAGISDRGRQFSAKYADVNFANLDNHTVEGIQARVASVKDLAKSEHDRDVKVWANAYIFRGETEKEAKDYYQYCVFEKGDTKAATNLLDQLGLNSKSLPPDILAMMKEHFMAGWGGFPLVGTDEQIVEGLQTMAAGGLDGTLLSWPNFVEGMAQFQETTYPMVVQAGLR